MSGSHRSRLATGLRLLFFQPRWRHPTYHLSRKQFTTYVESLTTSSGPSSVLTASSTAAISMRWLVVCGSAPLANAPSGTAHAPPPGPGFPLHAPSVYTIVKTESITDDAHD